MNEQEEALKKKVEKDAKDAKDNERKREEALQMKSLRDAIENINRLRVVTNALLQFAELKHDEVLNEISTFKNIEEKEQDNKEEIKGSVD